ADVVETCQQPPLRVVRKLEWLGHLAAYRDRPCLDVNDHVAAWGGVQRSGQPGSGLLGHLCRDESRADRVAAEDVSEAGCYPGLEAEVRERPAGVLAGRAAAEVRTRQQYLGLLRARLVQRERRISTPGLEQACAEAAALYSLQPRGRDD